MSALSELIKELDASNACGFDPVRFAFIQSLAKRIDGPEGAINPFVLKKLDGSVRAFKSELDTQRRQAKKTLKRIVVGFPEKASQADALYRSCEFRQLEKLNTTLRSQNGLGANANSLADLTAMIDARATSDDGLEEAQTFEGLLKQQEAQLGLNASDDCSFDIQAARPELQSMKVFRESMKHHHIDKIIDRAISIPPENPGPHNPHMLVIRAMTLMQDLSPQYLRRLSAYVETLLWLEKNASRVDDSKNLPLGQ